MVARILLELILAVLVIVAILVAAFRYAVGRQGPLAPPPELDVSRAPSSWFTDSRTTEDGCTEVCIVRVETKSGLIRERRVLSRLNNCEPGYGEALDRAMDDAYSAMRVANVNLNRR